MGFRIESGSSSHSIGLESERAPTLGTSCGHQAGIFYGRAVCGGNDKNKTGGYLVFDARGNGTGDIAPTMTGDHYGHANDYMAVCVGNGQADQSGIHDVCGALNCMHDQQAVMIRSVDSHNVCRIETTVRRLTPRECERLQGFPDGWVDIGEWTDEKGKKHKEADAPQYRALGNSIALPFWYWLLKRISDQCTEKTMGSLFDGIGGFPLCWQMINGDGSCRWSSEIEPFCIAVTKKHFGDEETGEKGDWQEYVKPQGGDLYAQKHQGR